METLAQVTGVDAVGLVNLIISSAGKATTHRRNCEQLAEHVRMIGNLLDKLKSTDLVKLPAIKEPLDCLEEALKKAFDLVESCRDKSFLYMIAMGWSVVYQFRRVQAEIDRYLKLVPLISLVHEFRMQHLKEGLVAIEDDQREYTLDEEDVKAQSVILKPDRSKKDANILENSLSRKYPELGFQEALEEEKEKLHIELQRSRTNNDTKQCRLIEHLIDVTENVVNDLPGKKVSKLLVNEPTYTVSGYVINNANSGYGDVGQLSEWQSDLFDCCREPSLSREQAIDTVMAYSLFCGCCCYTCCIRKKLRETYNIEGGSCDDFLTHLMCCCCAMVQEWRELQLRGFEGCQGRNMIPPPCQYMKP
ncbi:hypothetical protein Patl1_06672 [Pistacia atlantica]|uniref:Uncharacterized protein n=1 Tax=Pistacia atlantica TaxID=434234 RepID=A0ACC1BPF8_9ROSI|nr:hypothetical protein Patl1_06672 [Pistacia atlantica]